MKKFVRVFCLFAVLIILGSRTYSQISVSYYSSSMSKIGLGYNFTDRFWTELRLYGNTTFHNITPELVVCFNVISKEKHNIYLGFGGNVNALTGFLVPIGVQFTPLDRLNRFSFHIQLEPTLDLQSDFILQSSWGIRYKFRD
jgi:hypothetical protein